MHRIYETYLQGLAASIDKHDLARSVVTLLEAFDIPSFAYLSFQSQVCDDPGLISNYPKAWTASYFRRRYHSIDPVVRCARCCSEPFFWGEEYSCMDLSEAQIELFQEASDFGIRCGLTVPIHDLRGGIAAMTFATDRTGPEFERFIDRYQRALQLAATCFHVRVRNTLHGNRVVDGVRLTRREFECLQWAARGKSARDIAAILGIKRRTAAFHLDNTRRKLGVRTISQAVGLLASSDRTLR